MHASVSHLPSIGENADRSSFGLCFRINFTIGSVRRQSVDMSVDMSVDSRSIVDR